MPSIKYIAELMKHRLSAMVATSALAGAWLYGGGAVWNLLVVASGVFLLSGGASALNQWQEFQYDALMKRTEKRPIPSGYIHPNQALITAIGLCVLGAGLLFTTGVIPMLLGLSNLIFYNLLYTKLKRITTMAVFPGGIVGALPPMIGWTAMGGHVWDATIIYFATFIFLWQVPHFWLLIIKYGKEYEAAGFESISAKYNHTQIKTLVFVWVMISSLFLLSFPAFGILMPPALIALFFVLNLGFILSFYRLLFKSQAKSALRNAFILINSFAMSIMIFLVVVTNL